MKKMTYSTHNHNTSNLTLKYYFTGQNDNA